MKLIFQHFFKFKIVIKLKYYIINRLYYTKYKGNILVNFPPLKPPAISKAHRSNCSTLDCRLRSPCFNPTLALHDLLWAPNMTFSGHMN